MKPSFHITGAGAFLALVCVLVSVANLSFRNAQNLVAASNWVAHTDEIIAELESTRNSISDLEREKNAGAALTASDHSSLDVHLSRLQSLTTDNPRQQSRISQLRGQSTVANLRDSQNLRASLRIVEEMKSEEQQLLVVRTSQARAVSKATLRTIIIFSAIALFVCVLSYWALVKNLTVRERAEKALAVSESNLRDLLAREQELSRVDPMTTVFNRRGFYEALERERVRTERYRRPVTIAYVDVDNFKKVNDSLGHAVGDELLVQVSATLRTTLRASDVIGRLGGDEFAIILPETDAMAARITLEKLRLRLLNDMSAHGFTITFSIGAATFVGPTDSLDIMVRMADETMYAIKTHGKDSVSVCLMG
jgi:diguanylate cyclase (GGDEF)-like protein